MNPQTQTPEQRRTLANWIYAHDDGFQEEKLRIHDIAQRASKDMLRPITEGHISSIYRSEGLTLPRAIGPRQNKLQQSSFSTAPPAPIQVPLTLPQEPEPAVTPAPTQGRSRFEAMQEMIDGLIERVQTLESELFVNS